MLLKHAAEIQKKVRKNLRLNYLLFMGKTQHEFANKVDPDEKSYNNKRSHLHGQCSYTLLISL